MRKSTSYSRPIVGCIPIRIGVDFIPRHPEVPTEHAASESHFQAKEWIQTFPPLRSLGRPHLRLFVVGFDSQVGSAQNDTASSCFRFAFD